MSSSVRIAWRTVQRRLGVAGMGAMLAFAAAGAVAWFVPRIDRQTTGIHDELMAKRAARANHPIVAAPRARDLPEGLDEYVRGFPTLAQNADDIAQIFATAEEHHVTLAKGEYQLKSESGSPFIVYSATFPVRLPYATLKTFAAEVLDKLPHAALDEMQLSRDSAGATELDSVVRFTLIYRSP
jgi:hypothetical protein